MTDIFNDTRLKVGVTLTLVAPFFNNQAVNGKLTRRFTGIGYYKASVDVQYQAEDQYVFDQWLAQYRYGAAMSFPMNKSANLIYRGTQTGTVTTAAAAIAGARQIKVNLPLEVGTKFNFTNHKKVYEVVSYDATAKTMNIFPNLRGNVQVGEIINYRNPVMRLKIATTDTEQQLTQLGKVTLEMVEDV